VIGDNREASFERGGIYCVNPFGSGDISREIVVDGQPQINGNSQLVWEYSESDGKPIHTSIAGLCVTRTFLFVTDIDGFVRCFDKRNGRLHWKHEMNAAVIGTPLVVGDTLYVADEDGDVEVLRASANYEPIACINHEQAIESSPIFADETLFIVTRNQVFAIGK
jgi:outer membrane protein assembly factor BamB